MHSFLIRLIVVVGLIGTGSAIAVEAPSAVGQYNLPGKPPYLLAHYMQWYSTPWSATNGTSVDRTAPIWSHWKWDGGEAHHDPAQKLPDGRRNIASIIYPLIGVYDSSSPAVLHYHLATLKAAGVSGVTTIWYGPGSDTDKRLPLMLDEAEKLQMKVAICYEEKLNFAGYRHPKTRADIVKSCTADMAYIIEKYANHPAYLRRNGLPVVEQFNGFGKSEIGEHQLSPDEFKQVFAALPTKLAYIRQNLDKSYHPLIPGAYVWCELKDWPKQFAGYSAELREKGQLEFFMAMVCPGFDDTGVWGWGAGPRKKGYGMNVLKKTMDQALDHDPELVQLVTWNDFNEATCFEPTTQYGYQSIDALEQWWGQKTGRAVDLKDNRRPFEEYRKSCSEAERAEIPAAAEKIVKGK